MNVENIFYTSKESKDIRDYKCFYDPSQDKLIDASELKNSNWKEKHRERWIFFYRVVDNLVGQPQKELIKKSKEKIKDKKKLLDLLLDRLLLYFVVFFIIIFIIFYFKYLILSLFLSIGFFFFHILVYREIDYLDNEIKLESKKIENLIIEIEFLHNQIPEVSSKLSSSKEFEKMEKELEKDLEFKRVESLNKIMPANIDENNFNDFDRSSVSKGFKVLKEWALLQKHEIEGSFEKDTGLAQIVFDLKTNIATWRFNDTYNKPIYRALYIQYIYLLDENVNTYSFFYDFVTEKQYSFKSETFQYFHITNLLIQECTIHIHKEIDARYINENQNKYLLDNINLATIHMLLLSVSSGFNLQFLYHNNRLIYLLRESELDNLKNIFNFIDEKEIFDNSKIMTNENNKNNLENIVYEVLKFLKHKISIIQNIGK